MIWLTSDLHLGHDKDFIWGARGFRSSEEHCAAIVAEWNRTVKPEDEVYVLGDLVVGDECGFTWLRKLAPAKIHIVLGNHDTSALKQERYQSILRPVSMGYADVVKYKKKVIYLSHYPTFTGNFDDGTAFHTHTLNFHGHTHATTPFFGTNPICYNVGLDAHQNKLISIDDAIAECRDTYNAQKTCNDFVRDIYFKETNSKDDDIYRSIYE